ncbi:MAG: hypothetical protein KGL39_26070 [Patescibacteria group bacterium]|nr:hypothetical protein [Patescibacteria group bacterium]
MNTEPTTIIDEGAAAVPLPQPLLLDDGGGAIHWTWGEANPDRWQLEQLSSIWSVVALIPGATLSASGVATGLQTRVCGINASGNRVTGYSNVITPA